MKETSNFLTFRLTIEENLQLRKIANNLGLNKSEFCRLLIRPFMKKPKIVAGYQIDEEVINNFYVETYKNLQVCIKNKHYPSGSNKKKRKIKI